MKKNQSLLIGGLSGLGLVIFAFSSSLFAQYSNFELSTFDATILHEFGSVELLKIKSASALPIGLLHLFMWCGTFFALFYAATRKAPVFLISGLALAVLACYFLPFFNTYVSLRSVGFCYKLIYFSLVAFLLYGVFRSSLNDFLKYCLFLVPIFAPVASAYVYNPFQQSFNMLIPAFFLGTSLLLGAFSFYKLLPRTQKEFQEKNKVIHAEDVFLLFSLSGGLFLFDTLLNLIRKYAGIGLTFSEKSKILSTSATLDFYAVVLGCVIAFVFFRNPKKKAESSSFLTGGVVFLSAVLFLFVCKWGVFSESKQILSVLNIVGFVLRELVFIAGFFYLIARYKGVNLLKIICCFVAVLASLTFLKSFAFFIQRLTVSVGLNMTFFNSKETLFYFPSLAGYLLLSTFIVVGGYFFVRSKKRKGIWR